MKPISRKFHAALDYLSALILMSAPWVLNFSGNGVASTVAVVSGAIILLMSLTTNYEGGLAPLLPMAAHLNLDIILGILLASSHWIFGFKEEHIYLPHLIMGIIAVLSGFLTVRRSPHSQP